MISTTNIFTDIKEIPDTWVYEHYGKITLPDLSKTAMILSIFNPRDTNPSMGFYYRDGNLRFRDFSTGVGGDKVQFYMSCKQYFANEVVEYGQAIYNIISDYKEYLKTNKHVESKNAVIVKYTIESCVTKPFKAPDYDFWGKFNIKGALLERYNIRAIDHIELTNTVNTFKIRKPMMYGFFKKDGTLYKTYQPLEKEKKFNVYKQYTQGWEQLTWDKPNLVITSSMKDGLSLISLSYDMDFVAPNSETVMLREEQMNRIMKMYQNVFILYDNDATGNKNADKYVTKYGIKKIEVPLSKDISDSVRDHGVLKVKQILDNYL